MANPEHVEVVKAGKKAIDQWRVKNPGVGFDLCNANFAEHDLRKINLENANLIGANLTGALLIGANLAISDLVDSRLDDASLIDASLFDSNLVGATFNGADLSGANLAKANLTGADLSNVNLENASLVGTNITGTNLTGAILAGADLLGATLRGAILIYANLTCANLAGANISNANFVGVDLSAANLKGTRLKGCNLQYADFCKTEMYRTIIYDTDLSLAINIDKCKHSGPSILDRSVLIESGPLPGAFLKGCGLLDWEIEVANLYNSSISQNDIAEIVTRVSDRRAGCPIDVQPVFVSYSHANSEFVDRIGNRLDSEGIRYWRDIKDAEAGPIDSVLKRAITHNPIFLLVLSEASIKSGWVEYEIETASELGLREGRHTLCPVMLDDSWLSDNMLSGKVLTQIKKYMVTDFSGWEENGKFEEAFGKLVKGWSLHYAKN